MTLTDSKFDRKDEEPYHKFWYIQNFIEKIKIAVHYIFYFFKKYDLHLFSFYYEERNKKKS